LDKEQLDLTNSDIETDYDGYFFQFKYCEGEEICKKEPDEVMKSFEYHGIFSI